jgi:uncharacterized beta-barrel protein YwiB (DUF1934 family)
MRPQMTADRNERARMRYRTDPEYREKRKRYLRNYEKRRRERFLEILKMSDEEFLEEIVRPYFRGEI